MTGGLGLIMVIGWVEGFLSGREMFVWLIDEMLRVGRVRRVNSTQQHLRTVVQITPEQASYQRLGVVPGSDYGSSRTGPYHDGEQ